MSLWFMLALMTAAAVFAVLWPLGRRAAVPLESADAEIYKDQLRELERDLVFGLVPVSEAEAARLEIARRLLAADAEQPSEAAGRPMLRRIVALIALVALPLSATTLYLRLGSPQMPDLPLAARKAAASASAPIEQLVARVEKHLERNPSDGNGWEVLAPVLMRLGRYSDAVMARRHALDRLGETASRRADLGEAIAAAAGGVVTAAAKSEFERAVAINSAEAKARFFLGVAAEQDGRHDEAAAIWRNMLNGASPDAPWAPAVRRALAQINTPHVRPDAVASESKSASAPASPGPTRDDIAAASNMNEDQRSAMVSGMVDRLAARLAQHGDDPQGWLRLVRAYAVLKDRNKVRSAVGDARKALANDADRLRSFNEGLKDLNVDSEALR